jgi:hypothetical protein
MKNLCVQLFREEIFILLKDKRVLVVSKFLIIGERRRTTANHCEPLRTTANGGEPLRKAVIHCERLRKLANGYLPFVF